MKFFSPQHLLIFIEGFSLLLFVTASHDSESLLDLHCQRWPRGWPVEHHDESCNRQLQNSRILSEVKNNPLTLNAYLNIPEEKTWVCPLEGDDEGVSDRPLVIGRETRWILYNRASTPIVVSRVNESPMDVSMEGISFGGLKEMKSAVYPHGPIVLPGYMAVVNGYEGQLFTAREYKEDPRLIFSSMDNEHIESFKNSLPRTWALGTGGTRFTDHKSDIMHVLGHPGRVLMKHRMGMIHIKNDSGVTCPEQFGGISDIGFKNRTNRPIDLDPDCNFVQKGMINEVGCPIDIYFAPPKSDPESSFSCEFYSYHMGSLESFLKSGQTDVDSFNSPILHQRTYDSHSFVVRTSHDKSYVGRIDIEADNVYDCPEVHREVVDVEVSAGGIVTQSIAEPISSNATLGMYGRFNTAHKQLNAERNFTNYHESSAHYANLTQIASSVCKGVTCGSVHYAS